MLSHALLFIFVIDTVVLGKLAAKSLRKCPKHVAVKLAFWIRQVEDIGLEQVRRIPGYHDEALKGNLVGKRSIRLSKAYRAVYMLKKDTVEFVLIEDVSNHYGD